MSHPIGMALCTAGARGGAHLIRPRGALAVQPLPAPVVVLACGIARGVIGDDAQDARGAPLLLEQARDQRLSTAAANGRAWVVAVITLTLTLTLALALALALALPLPLAR